MSVFLLITHYFYFITLFFLLRFFAGFSHAEFNPDHESNCRANDCRGLGIIFACELIPDDEKER